MNVTALRVAARYLTARADAGPAKFQQLALRAHKELLLLPRLFKTYDRQAHGYKTSDPVKAKQTLAKITGKVKTIHDIHTDAVRLVDAFNAHYKPTTDFKRQLHSSDFMGWFGRYLKALKALKEAIRDDSVTLLTSGFDGGFVREGHNPLLDLDNAATSLRSLWPLLVKADPDPVNIPAGGSDTERFLAFLTPSIRRLAKQVAAKVKSVKLPNRVKAARPLVWLVLEDVNASSASSIAEGILPFDDADMDLIDFARPLVSPVSRALDYGVVEAAAFGVALLEEVGEAALAKRLTAALAKELAPHTVAD